MFWILLAIFEIFVAGYSDSAIFPTVTQLFFLDSVNHSYIGFAQLFVLSSTYGRILG
jgi:hypothetical protein